jgi:SAM-dependent methyltransferase
VSGGEGRGPAGNPPQGARIDKDYYDRSTYFEGGTEHLTDLASRFQRYRIDKVLGIHEPGRDARVVDLGCGWGTFEFALAHRVAEVVGVDFSARSIELCNRRLAADPRPNVRFVEADAGATGLEGGVWDLVVAADLFEHLYPDDSARIAHEAFRLLRPGGYFSVWTPHRGHILEILKNRGIVLRPDPTHVDYKSMERLKRLLEDAGFAVDRAYYAESHLPGLRMLERSLMGLVPWLRRRIAMLGRKPHQDRSHAPSQ